MPPHISLSSLPQYLLTALLTSVGCVVTTSLLQFSWKVLNGYRSALHVLPGPKSVSWFSGSVGMKETREPLELCEEWAEQYGKTFAFRSLLNKYQLFTTDPKALSHIMSHPNEFPKTEELQRVLGAIIGDGLLVTEGIQHRHQRKVMNPAFGPVQIRELTPIMMQKSQELCDVLRARFSDAESPKSGDKSKAQIEVNIPSWLDKVTLDIIGLAGFGYSFDALHATDDNPNELNAAIKKVFAFDPQSFFAHLKTLAPIFRHIPTQEQRDQNQALRTMRRIGNDLITQKKAAMRAENGEAVMGRDLLSLLIRANMAPDLAEGSRMNDKDVLSQVPTFLVAGHETTSTGTSWALFALATHPAVQAKLRAELLGASTENPTMDELNAFPYLDAVVRESLRRHPPVQATSRRVAEDTVIPLDEPFVGRDGVKRHEITISKDDWLVIPIQQPNTSKEVWGEDAAEFKPERWLAELPEAVHSTPSIYSHLLSFISGGRACIGYRFAITEMKALLFSLIRSFEFELGVPEEDISYKEYIVMRPMVKSQKERGPQLPMIVRLVKID